MGLLTAARIYHLRHVMHAYSDEDCLRILGNIKPMMKRNFSIIVINEPILLDQGASLSAIQADLSQMACRATMLRTRSQWASLVEAAGLRVRHVWSGFPRIESVIEAVLPTTPRVEQ